MENNNIVLFLLVIIVVLAAVFGIMFFQSLNAKEPSKVKIISNKTQNIDFEFPLETIPKEYIGDFIRGFIDGDGSFESHEGTFTPSIVGTSKKWLCQIGDIVSAETELNYSITEIKGKTCNYYTLRWSANRVNKLEKITEGNNINENINRYLNNSLTKSRISYEIFVKSLKIFCLN